MRQLPSLNMLRVFEEVARHCSCSQAALGLNVTQGAVSRQIKQLEDYLGVALFIRTPRYSLGHVAGVETADPR
ncbi:putative choline sulfate-utilization transcription factor [compost metagenome]